MALKPKVSRRYPRGYRAELAIAPGPWREADTGTGSLRDTFGYAWLLFVEKDGRFRLFQAQGNEWVERPPIDPLPVRDQAAHVSLGFDQNGRPILAWEEHGTIYVWAWDDATQHYAVRYSWPGHDPILFQDAFTTGDIPSSDVVVFYVEPDRASVSARLQREQYGTPHGLFSGEKLALDQAYTAGGRVVLFGEGAGGPLILQTDLYPLTGADSVNAPAALAGAHVYVRDIYDQGTLADALTSPTALSGAYINSRLISQNGVVDALNAPAALASRYQQVRLIEQVAALDSLNAPASAAGTYTYFRDIYPQPNYIDALNAPALLGGAYRAI